MAPNFGHITLSFILLIHSFSSKAQADASFSSAYNAGMLSSDRFSTDHDVFVFQTSTLPSVTSPHISANIQSRYTGFGLYAMGFHLASSLPMNFGLGISTIGLGHPDWKTSGIIAGAGKKLSQNVSIGISQHLNRAKVANEGRPWTGSSATSGSYDNGNWGLAIAVTGLMKWGRKNNLEHFSIKTGAYIHWLSQTTMYLAMDYIENQLISKVGIHQFIMKNVELFGAFQVYPARYGLGFLVPLSDQVESIVSTQYHPVLGWSPSIGLQWHTLRSKE